MQIEGGILRNEAWARVLGLEHGFTTKAAPGDIARRLKLVRVRQVHGRRVLIAGGAVVEPAVEADAIVTATRGMLLAVATADCLPVLLQASKPQPIAAAVHCGWRGLRAQVLEAAVAAMRAEFGVAPADVCAAFGPSIGRCCYEIGTDVEVPFQKHSIVRGDSRLYLDLEVEARLQLEALGVPVERISSDHRCTHCEPDLFHSYRRDGPRAGRMLNFVGWV